MPSRFTPRNRKGITVVFNSLPPAKPTFAPGSSLVIRVATGDGLGSGEAEVARLAERLHRGNPYTLDQLGRLNLPGVDPIALSGLDEAQAALRISTDSALAGLRGPAG